MSQLTALRAYLEQHFSRAIQAEGECTCGAGNHVRVCFFRVDGQPVSAIIPEGAGLTADELREAVGCSRAEPFSNGEWDQVCTDTELGHTLSFDNPFGASVLFDELLQSFPNLVFCPRMFSGERGLCFRVPTEQFLELTHALVLPLTAQICHRADEWAV